MRHQTITVAVPDDAGWRKGWRKGDHIGGSVRVLVVDAQEPVEVPRRYAIDFTLSFDELPTPLVSRGDLVDDLATWIVMRVRQPGSPLAWPETRNVDIQINGESSFTP